MWCRGGDGRQGVDNNDSEGGVDDDGDGDGEDVQRADAELQRPAVERPRGDAAQPCGPTVEGPRGNNGDAVASCGGATKAEQGLSSRASTGRCQDWMGWEWGG